MKAVFIVVDMVNDFFDRSPALSMQRAQLVSRTNLLVRTFRSINAPMFWVRQEFAADLSHAFLEMRANKVSITIVGNAGCDLLRAWLYRRGNDITKIHHGSQWRTRRTRE